MYQYEQLLASGMLHLSRDELPAILRIQQQIVLAAHQFMLDAGVTHVFPVMLTPLQGAGATHPGDTRLIDGRIVPADIAYGDLHLRLMKSKSRIVRKQLIRSNPQISSMYWLFSDIRLETVEQAESGKHLYEFSMIDFEFRDVGCQHVMEFSERLICYIFDELNRNCGNQLEMFRTTPLPSFSQLPCFFEEELLAKYGEGYAEVMSKTLTTPFWLCRPIFASETHIYEASEFPDKGRYITFDLIWPGGFGEALSGAETEYDYDRLLSRIKEKHTNIEEFEWYLELACRNALPKSAGAGIGLERLTQFVTNKPDINEVTVFLRKPHAQSLF